MKPKARMNRIATACVASVFTLAWHGSTVSADVASTQPAASPAASTQPVSNPVNDQPIVADFHALQKQLQVYMPDPGVLADPARRAAAAPNSIPLLAQMKADLEQLASHNAAAKPKLAAQEREIVNYMAILGDPKSIAELASKAASADPAVSLKGQIDQLSVRWDSAGKNADPQDAIVSDLETLDKAHSDSTELTVFNYHLYQTAASPAVADRVRTMIVNDLHNPAAEQVCQIFGGELKLAQAKDKPLLIEGKTMEGKSFSSKEWTGKVILVDFWATWCVPCRGELPRVKAMYDQYHEKGLEVLGVSNDFSGEALTHFVAKSQLPWPELFDPGAAAQQQFNPIAQNQGITAIPTMFLIDRKGIVRSITAREEMESLIPKLLSEPG